MNRLHIYFAELRRTIGLAAPMILGQLLTMSMGMVDAAMVGRGAGTTSLAGLGFGVNLVHIPGIAGFGIASAVSILVAQAYGAGKRGEPVRIVRHGVVLAASYGALAAVGIMFLIRHAAFFGNFGQEPEVVEASAVYVQIFAWSFMFAHIFSCLRSFCEAQERPWLALYILSGMVLLNVLLNWLLIFGNLGFPALGLTGAGLATLCAQICALTVMVLAILRTSHFQVRIASLFRPAIIWADLRRILALGIPVGLQIFFEVFCFIGSAMMMGWISAETLAAHTIAIQVAGFSFMIPLGLSFAVSIRTGQAAGAKDREGIRRIIFSSLGITALWSCLAASTLLLLNESIPRLFSEDPAVLALAASFLIIGAVFQVVDQIQVVALGVLRGLADTRIPTILSLSCYWLIGLSLAYTLAFPLGLGGRGIWMALAIALGCAAIALNWRIVVVWRKL